jgi:hypothetical protein
MDVRPAVDSFGSAWDRLKMAFRGGVELTEDPAAKHTVATTAKVEATSATTDGSGSGSSSGSGSGSGRGGSGGGGGGGGGEENTDPREAFAGLQSVFARMQGECHEKMAALQQCDTEEECSRASMHLSACIGGIVCPAESATFNADPNQETYAALRLQIDAFEEAAREIAEAAKTAEAAEAAEAVGGVKGAGGEGVAAGR